MLKNDITVTTLSSGLKIVHKSSDSAVEYFGAYVDSGSREDPPGLEGLAHFVEHVIFKGTAKRKSWHIINRMERCGGELNAWTTKENTVVYTVYPTGNFTRAAELIGDLLCHSVFPEHELVREREVVADEIDSYRDMPSEAVFDDFDDLIFKDSQLGHNILGSADSLRRFTPEICREYLKNNFTSAQTVIFYSGRLRAEKVTGAVERYFADLPEGNNSGRRIVPAIVSQFDHTVDLGHHQANTVIGARIPGMFSHERFTLALLSNIIGGPGMNSLLNVALRERRGLVYSVETSASLMSDCGLFTIYYGCDHEDNARCRRIVAQTIDRIASKGLSERFVKAAARQYLGQLTLAADNHENSVMSMARAVMYYGSVLDREEITARIESITPAQLRQTAVRILSEGLSSLTLL